MYNEDKSTRYNPHANDTLKNNDGIRTPILQPDLYVLKRRSFLYVKGKLSLLEEKSKDIIGDAILDTNSVAFTFDEIRCELNGVEIPSEVSI